MKFFLLCFACLLTQLQATLPCNVYGTLDFLYWKPHVEGIEYVAAFDEEGSGDIFEVDWEFKPGFRLGLGSFICDCWDLSLTYTWYRGNATDFFPGGTGIATFSSSGNGAIGFANAEWTLHYHTLDLILRRQFLLAKSVVLTPSLGIRGAYTKQSYNIEYFFPDTGDLNGINNRQRVGAVGPKIGLSSSWLMTSNWSLFGEGAISLLWSDYRVKWREFNGTNLAFSHNFISQLFVPEYRVGLCWQDRWQSRFPVSFCVAWEQQIWINYNQMLYGPVQFDQLILNRNTNLNLYGVSLRATFGF
jgi:hypothetical protein